MGVSVCVFVCVCGCVFSVVTFKLNFKLGNKLNLLSIFIFPRADVLLVFSIFFLAFFCSYC